MTDLSGRLASSNTLYGTFLGLGTALAAEARARISQNARALCIIATLTAGTTVAIGDGRLHVIADTATRRFVRLQQCTVSARLRPPPRPAGA